MEITTASTGTSGTLDWSTNGCIIEWPNYWWSPPEPSAKDSLCRAIAALSGELAASESKAERKRLAETIQRLADLVASL